MIGGAGKTNEQIKAVGALSESVSELGSVKRIEAKIGTVISNQSTPSTTYYKHSIVMSGLDDANNEYSATFNFTNTTATAYTTSRQIADALRALGYYERNGVAASGESELETEDHNVSFVCGYSEEYCNGNEADLKTLLFLDETEYHTLVFAVNEEDTLTDTVTVATA